MKYIAFDTAQQAIRASYRISRLLGCPLVGRNARTRRRRRYSQKTEWWDRPKRGRQGKWYIRRPPARIFVAVFPDEFDSTDAQIRSVDVAAIEEQIGGTFVDERIELTEEQQTAAVEAFELLDVSNEQMRQWFNRFTQEGQ